MPYGLFDYVPDSSIHTMGLSPLPQNWQPYQANPQNYQPATHFRDNTTGQIVDRSVLESKATFYGGNMTAAQQNAKAQQLAQEISTRYSPVQPAPVSNVKVGGGGGMVSGGGGQGSIGAVPWQQPPQIPRLDSNYTTIKTGSTLTNPTTLRMPEDPTQQVTTAAIYEEGNVPPRQSPPSGGGSCPPGYAPVQSPVNPTPKPPGTPTTMAAICSENPAFCNNFTLPRPGGEEMVGTGLMTDGFVGSEAPAPYTPPGGWGAYNPLTRAGIGNEDIRNFPAEQAKQNNLFAQMEQKRIEYGQSIPGTDIFGNRTLAWR